MKDASLTTCWMTDCRSLKGASARRVPWRERRLRFLYRHPTLLYLGGLAALTAGIVSAFLFAAHALGVSSPLMLLLLGTLALIPGQRTCDSTCCRCG